MTEEVGSEPAPADLPLATVIIPARNEKDFIRPCLDSICAQTERRIQVIVVDGESDDGTQQIVAEYSRADPRVELVHNPDRIIPKALNLAVEAARAPIVVRVDAHATVPPGYVTRILEHFEQREWGGVGGRKDGVGRSRAGRAVAAAMSSPFGVGNSTYHYGTEQKVVEHIPFGAYPTDLIRGLGGWDENLRVNQDFEFDYRVRSAGRELLFDPELKIDWYSRQTIRELFDQYRRYGRGKTRVAALHPRSVRPRHLAAPALVASLLVSLLAAAGGLAVGVVWLVAPLALVAGAYAIGVLLASVVTARRAGPGWLLLPAAFAAMHIGWGMGFWGGVATLLRERMTGRSGPPPPPQGAPRLAASEPGPGARAEASAATAAEPSAAPVTPTDDAEASGGQGGLARAAVGGVVWQGFAHVSGRVLMLVATVLLARLLTPLDFGVVGLALVFVGYAETVSSLGVAQAVIYLDDTPRTRTAAVLLAIGTALPFVLLAQLVAPAVAAFFGNADVEPLFRIVVLSLLISSLSQVPDALLRKRLQFRRRMAASVLRAGVRGVASVALALGGAGPWAIAGGLLIGEAAFAVTSWVLAGLRLSRRTMPKWMDIRTIAGYGAPAAIAGLLSTLVLNVDYLFVGRWLGAEALGLYTLAFRIPEMAVINILYLVSAVAFPVFSSVGGDRARLVRGYLTVVRAQSAYGAVVGAWLAVAAPVIVPVVFGPKWTGAVAAMQALGLYAAFRAMGAGAADAYKSIGRPRLAAGVSALRIVILLPALLVALQYGIGAVALAQAGAAAAFVVLAQGVAARALGIRLSAIAGALRTGLVAGAASAAGAAAGMALAGQGIVAVGASGLGAAGLAALALLLTDKALVTSLVASARGRREALA